MICRRCVMATPLSVFAAGVVRLAHRWRSVRHGPVARRQVRLSAPCATSRDTCRASIAWVAGVISRGQADTGAAVRELAIGNGVSILPAATELTTQRAADLLNVSRPYLIRLLERGEIPYRKVGTHRRVQLSDVIAYRGRRDLELRRALDELTHDGEELGLYEDFYASARARVAESSEPRPR